MEKDRLEFLHKQYIEAIQYCNEIDENEPFSDLETAEDNFWTDVFMLAFFPICADWKITEAELTKFNTFVAECGGDLHIDTKSKKRLMGLFKFHKFDLPKSLIVFCLRARVDILKTPDDDRESSIKYNLEYLDYILCHYADLMVSMADEITPKVKATILKCLNICCEYISKELSLPFPVSENVLGFIENPNVADS